ncbi:MAG: CRISPR system precrRNA processing endoribonuclease RAMP protein Cas6 [Magnetococcus sp. YQC-9]
MIPFDLPTQTLTFQCQLERPILFHFRQDGATPGTTLAGAFGTALLQVGCLRQRSGQPRCLGISGEEGFFCPEFADCAFHWLFKPYFLHQNRSPGRPVRLRAPQLETGNPVQNFSLEVALWGRHAVASREVVTDAIRLMGDNGLNHAGEPIRFRLLDQQVMPISTFQQEIERLSTVVWQKALLVFESPLLMQSRATDADGASTRVTTNSASFRLESLLGNAAYEIMAWHLEEHPSNEHANREVRHALCRNQRQAAVQALHASIDDWQPRLVPIDLGQRISRSNGRRFPIRGLLGHVELTGRINDLLPWLVLLEWLGGGQKRSMGFGATRLWLR